MKFHLNVFKDHVNSLNWPFRQEFLSIITSLSTSSQLAKRELFSIIANNSFLLSVFIQLGPKTHTGRLTDKDTKRRCQKRPVISQVTKFERKVKVNNFKQVEHLLLSLTLLILLELMFTCRLNLSHMITDGFET